jgi:hypothetical protein
VQRDSDFSDRYYRQISADILTSFDQHVRMALSQSLQDGPVKFPAFPMPNFWDVVRRNASKASGSKWPDSSAIVAEVERLRDKAEPYREYVGKITEAYQEGNVSFVLEQSQMLNQLVSELALRTDVPLIRWRRAVIPVKLKLPFVELDKLAIKFPTLNPLRKSHFAFLHAWAFRNFND